MPCEACHVQFSVFKRKKSCTECRRLYCNQCLVKRRERIICDRCLIFTQRPLTKIELLKLKPKDLIFFLQSKHISTTGCVEKEELVNLVLTHVNNSIDTTNDQSADETCANPFDQIKQTCQNLFTSLSDRIASDFKFDTKSTPTSPTSPSSQNSQNIFTQPRPSRRPSAASASQSAYGRPSANTTPQSSSTATHSAHSYANTVPQPPPASESNAQPEPTINRSRRSKPRAPSNPDIPQTSPTNATSAVRRKSAATARGRLSAALLDEQLSTGNASGCECSDDEVIANFHRSQSDHSQSVKDDSVAAGPSGTQQHIQPPKPDDSDDHSSFEELFPNQTTNAATNDADNWQFLDNESPLNETAPLQTQPSHPSISVPTTTATRSPTIIPNRILRRRSDTSLLSNDRQTEHMDTTDASSSIHPDGSSPRCKRSRIACDRCGKHKAGLRRYVNRFKRQLENRNLSEEEMRVQLDAFLAYLEHSQQSMSLDLADEATDEGAGSAMVDGPEVDSQHDADLELGSNQATDGDIDEEMDDDPDFWFGDDEGINVYGTDDPTGGQRQFVNLSEYEKSSDLDDLTVKQLKEILMLNRVDFKGCCEKNELLERVKRLWEELTTSPAVDKMPTNDLCKICMDAPIECVILECGHVATCTNCGKVLSECPICRQYIVRVVRLFRA